MDIDENYDMIRVRRCVRYDDNGDSRAETQQSLH